MAPNAMEAARLAAPVLGLVGAARKLLMTWPDNSQLQQIVHVAMRLLAGGHKSLKETMVGLDLLMAKAQVSCGRVDACIQNFCGR